MKNRLTVPTENCSQHWCEARFPHIVLASLTIAVWITASCLAEVREIRTLREIEPAITADTLLVFDIDNTLIEPTGNLGSDHWYYFLVRKYREFDQLNEAAADRKATTVWDQVQSRVSVRAVEPGTAGFVRRQQAARIPTIGLTARVPEIAAITVRQLRTTGIRLDRHTVFNKDLSWTGSGPVRFSRGILFVGEQTPKGSGLVDFLRRIHAHPKRIVFVDDKWRHVIGVDKSTRAAGMECFAFRYGALDEKVNRFNADLRDLRLFLGDLPQRRPVSRQSSPRRAPQIESKKVAKR